MSNILLLLIIFIFMISLVNAETLNSTNYIIDYTINSGMMVDNTSYALANPTATDAQKGYLYWITEAEGEINSGGATTGGGPEPNITMNKTNETIYQANATTTPVTNPTNNNNLFLVFLGVLAVLAVWQWQNGKQ